MLLALALVACGQARRDDAQDIPKNDNASSTSSDKHTSVGSEVQPLADQQFGKKISPRRAMSLEALFDAMEGKKAMPAKVEGKVKEVCQVKGCWMTLEKTDGSTMRVTFKDYGFFVPTDLPGKKVVVEGQARRDTVPVKVLRHYAEDAGKSQEAIASIKEPEVTLGFVADGVLVRKDI